MGWIAWERFTCTIDCDLYPNDCVNEKLFRQMADRLAEDGYKKVGYQYINIDDCWSEKERSESMQLVPDKSRFPQGMSSLAEYIHSKGLKFGIYGDCGTKTCAGYPAQLKSEQDLQENYFDNDANLFAEWGVDSLKFDGCNLEAGKAESICPRMASAIEKARRPMVVICEWPFYMLRRQPKLSPNYTLAQQACNAWRYFDDVEDSWPSILSIVDFTISMQQNIAPYHGPGHWFDPDQLVIGNFALSVDEARVQMALWCIWSAPLYMGNDLRDISTEMANILKNVNLINVDQDALGVFGLMVKEDNNGNFQAFVKPVEPIKNGCPSFVIAYLNRKTLGNPSDVTFNTRDLLSRSPIALAAQRYASVYSNSNPGGLFLADGCKKFLQYGMTKDSRLIIKSVTQERRQEVEEKSIMYEATDLFGDGHVEPVALNGNLTLRVNPSGVRIVKLTLLDN